MVSNPIIVLTTKYLNIIYHFLLEPHSLYRALCSFFLFFTYILYKYPQLRP